MSASRTIGNFQLTTRIGHQLLVAIIATFGFATAAHAAPADFDTTFADDGIFTTADENPAVFSSNAVLDSIFLPDGDLITVGASSSPQRWHLERINSDGSMDSGFGGGDGKVTIDISPTYTAAVGSNDVFAFAYAVRLDENGKLVVAGTVASAVDQESMFAVARFDADDGDLDTTFNSTGDDPGANYFSIKSQTGQFARAYDLDFTSDNKIVLAGEAMDVTTPLSGGSPNFDYAFARLNTNGTLDTSLESDGTALKSIVAGTTERAYSVSVQADDKIVLAGKTRNPDIGLGSAFGIVRFDTDGSVDSTFGIRGDGRTFVPGGGEYVRMVRQQNGRFVVVGTTNSGDDCAVARLDQFGQLDLTFSDDGQTSIDFDEESDTCTDVAVDAQGRIVIVGLGLESGFPGNPQFAAARLTAAGLPDTSFGSNGRLLVDLTLGTDTAETVSISSNTGKIAIGGSQGVNSSPTAGAVLMLEGGTGTPFQPTFPPPLTLDPTFNVDGKVVNDVSGGASDQINETVVQSDGKTVSVGFSRQQVGTPPSVFFKQDVAVTRRNIDGSLDTSFGGGDGIATVSDGSTYFSGDGQAIALQNDGKIVVVGTVTVAGAGYDFLVARFNSDGSNDPTFGDGGDGNTIINYVNIGEGYSDGANAVVVLDDGSIIAAGQSDPSASDDVTFVKLTSAGFLDTSWGTNSSGVLEAGVTGGVNDDRALDLIQQPDGKLLAVGFAEVGGVRDLAFVRIDEDGNFDTALNATTGSEGRKIVSIGAGNDIANAVEVDADGKIVVAGTTDNGADDDFFVARFDSDIELDATFAGDGVATGEYDGNSIDDAANDMVIQADGKIVVVGDANYGTGDDFGVARFNPDGSPDSSFDGNGAGSTPIGSFGDSAKTVALQADGRIIAAGKSSDGSALDSVLIRIGDAPPSPFVPPAAAPPAAPPIAPPVAAASWTTKIYSPRYNKRYKRTKFKKFSGKVRVNGASVKRLYVAVRKIDKRRCLWLRNTKGKYKKLRMKKRRCASKRWIKVRTSKNGAWSLKLRRKLSKGRYEVFARVVLSDGSTDTKFRRKVNYTKFRLR